MFGFKTMLQQVSIEPLAVITAYYVHRANGGADARQHTPFREIKLLIIPLIMLYQRAHARAREITAARPAECVYLALIVIDDLRRKNRN